MKNAKTDQDVVDHYDVLGVPAAADLDEIKRAFRALSRKYHPDVNQQCDDEIYRRITAAYNILSDPERRSSYDSKRLYQMSSSSAGKQLVRSFEDALQQRWTKPGAGHVCNPFCSCDVEGVNEPPINSNKMQRPGKTGHSGDARAQQEAARIAEEFGDGDRVITPPSAFEELSSFLSQAKRASYSRPRIYTCHACGGASASREQCDLCGAMQSGSAQSARNKVYSMHKFGSHLDDDRRHELVHKHHISRSAPAHTRRRMPDVGMFDSADIDTGVQRIWSQVSPEDDIQDSSASRFEAGLDFFGVTTSPVDKEEEKGDKSDELSDVHLSAISDGCWILGDMESSLTESELAEAVKKSVLQKEAQVGVLEAKVQQCRRELADLERDLAQARGELIEARAQQGWSGAGAVGMGGAGAVFSSSGSPARQLSDAFSTISTASTQRQDMAQRRDWDQVSPVEEGQEQGQRQKGQGWSGPGGVGMGGAGALLKGDGYVAQLAQEVADDVQGWDREVMSGRIRSTAGTYTAAAKYGSLGSGAHAGPACSCDKRPASRAFEPPTICSTCGCHTSAGGIICDCCHSPLTPPVSEAQEGKHAGLTKVFTMHKAGRTQLSEEVMHTLVHPRHHSEHHHEAESMAQGQLQGRFDVDLNYFGIEARGAASVAYRKEASKDDARPSQGQHTAPVDDAQQLLASGREDTIAAQESRQAAARPNATEVVIADSWFDSDSAHFGTLAELNSYLSSPPSASTYTSASMSNLERETPDVPWGVAGGLEESDGSLGLGKWQLSYPFRRSPCCSLPCFLPLAQAPTPH